MTDHTSKTQINGLGLSYRALSVLTELLTSVSTNSAASDTSSESITQDINSIQTQSQTQSQFVEDSQSSPPLWAISAAVGAAAIIAVAIIFIVKCAGRRRGDDSAAPVFDGHALATVGADIAVAHGAMVNGQTTPPGNGFAQPAPHAEYIQCEANQSIVHGTHEGSLRSQPILDAERAGSKTIACEAGGLPHVILSCTPETPPTATYQASARRSDGGSRAR